MELFGTSSLLFQVSTITATSAKLPQTSIKCLTLSLPYLITHYISFPVYIFWSSTSSPILRKFHSIVDGPVFFTLTLDVRLLLYEQAEIHA